MCHKLWKHPKYLPTSAHTSTIQTMKHSQRPTQAVTHIQSRTQTQTENEQSLTKSTDSKLVLTATIAHIWCFHDAQRKLRNTKQGPHAEREASHGAWNYHELWMMNMPTMKLRVGITLNMHIHSASEQESFVNKAPTQMQERSSPRPSKEFFKELNPELEQDC